MSSRPDRDRSSPDRGRVRALIGAVRVFLVLLVLGAIVVGAATFTPQGLDVPSDGVSPLEPRPSPTGDGDPDRVHPDDPDSTTYDGASGSIEADATADRVHREVNERRANHGLEPIDWDDTIASVARVHSVDMDERDYFAHENPDGDGPFDRFQEVGSYCRGYGENLAITWVGTDVRRGDEIERYGTAAELAEGLVDQWMDSPEHRDAILEDDWDRGGVGIHLTDEGQVFATHNFCLEW